MIIKAKIEFEFDSNDIDISFDTIPELENYVIKTMAEDIYSMTIHNEIAEAIRVEIL